MSHLFPRSKGSPGVKPTTADENSHKIIGTVEVAFALVGVGTILLIGMIWCCCKKSGRCKQSRRSRDRERSISVIHITNNTTRNCVHLEGPPSYCDAIATPECPPPPYPGFRPEDCESSRYERTPPPAYHNMGFTSGGDDRADDRRSFRGGSEGQGRIRPEGGTEDESFLDSDNNNNRARARTPSAVPPHGGAIQGSTVTQGAQFVATSGDELPCTREARSNSENMDETAPMVIRRDPHVLIADVGLDFRNSVTSESELIC